MGDRRRRRIWTSLAREPLARHRRLLLATALAGFCIGAAIPLLQPPEAIATTSLVLNHPVGDDPDEAMSTDVSLARSREVAVRVVNRLGLDETPDKLLTQYSATARTDRVLQLSARARTGAEAKRIVRTIGQVFVVFRVEQNDQQLASLRRMLADARSEAAGLHRTAVPTLAAGGSDEGLTRELIIAADQRVKEVEIQVAKEQAASAPVARSIVLDPPTVRTPSRLVQAGRSGAIGFVAALGGMAVLLVLSGLLTDRPRREREIADALGTPAAVHVASEVRAHSEAHREADGDANSEAHGDERAGTRELDAAVDLLLRQLATDPAARPTLLVVAVECVPAAAAAVAALATRCADGGDRLLLADLSRNGVLARRFGALGPGTTPVLGDGTGTAGVAGITVHRPDAAEPRGRLHHGGADDDDDLLVAWALSDVVVSLTELSPSNPAGHLHTWADRAVAVVSPGRSSAAKLRSVGELVRASDVSLESVIVLDAAETAASSEVSADDTSPATDLATHSAEPNH
jgi:capsular polysaccharide biosynthesis protein